MTTARPRYGAWTAIDVACPICDAKRGQPCTPAPPARLPRGGVHSSRETFAAVMPGEPDPRP